MKTHPLHRYLLTAAAAFCFAPSLVGQALEEILSPAGKIDVTALSSFGTTNVQYPYEVEDLVSIDDKHQLTAKEYLRLRVRIAGVGHEAGGTETPAALWVNVGGGGWQLAFFGASSSVNPEAYLIDVVVNKGQSVDLAGAGKNKYGNWGEVRMTMNGDVAVASHLQGDFASAPSQEVIKSFLTQFIASDSHVALGSREVLYLFELQTRDSSSIDFDMQDLVVIVSLEPLG